MSINFTEERMEKYLPKEVTPDETHTQLHLAMDLLVVTGAGGDLTTTEAT